MTAFLTSLSRLLLWYAPALALIIASRLALMYFQLSSYQFMGFLAALKRQSRRVWLPGALPGVACLVITYLAGALAQVNTAWAIISPLLGAGLMLACAYWADLLSYRRREGKSSLKMTARVKRLYAVYAALIFVAFSLLRRAAPIMGLNAMVILPLPLWVLLAGLMAWPIERVIYELYFSDDLKVQRERPDLTIIGFTGSYGKTSVKFFLQTILSQKYNALCTPTSVNTPMGISACLRRDLTPAHNVFIAEMGARHRGDIKELCRLLRPSIGILTSVGPQHLETLGDIETVKQTKYDLIRALPSDGFAVFGDNSGIVRDLYENTRIPKAITDAPDTDIWAEDVLADEDSTRFTLCFRDGRRLCCQTYVQGAHALRNILTASAVAAHLGLSDRQLIHGIALFHPVITRFRIDTGADGVHRINNGFNSNPVSSAETLEELSRDKYEGRRIIITPGFVELGREEEKYNRELGVNIAKVADIVLLVGPRHTAPIRQGLLESGFHAGDIHTFDTLMDANAYLDTVKQQGDYVLYENDLPDHYSEKKRARA